VPKNFSKTDLDNVIRTYLKLDPSAPLPSNINKQLNRYIVDSGYSTLDIARTIAYYVEVLHRKLDKIYGIFFVQDLIDDARKYFNNLEAKQAEKAEEAKKLIASENKDNTYVFNVNVKAIAERRITRKFDQIDLSTIDIDGDSDDGK
jgi:hypothetical protein